MRRRLRLMALAISAISIAAFLVPLAFALRSHQRSVAVAQASQTASEVATVAAVFGDDTTRLQNYFMSLYGASPYELTVWYADGRSMALPPSGRGVGEPPSALGSLQRSGLTGIRERTRAAGGIRFLAAGPTTPTPAMTAPDAAPPPLVDVFVPDRVLTDGVAASYLRFGAIALVIVVASLVVADRVAGMRPPGSGAPAPVREPAPV